jgi:murein DD-endopeptidase MepM/ murein hydrolase activator NlpD
LILLALAGWLLAGRLLAALPVFAQEPAPGGPVVQPGDISTPTPAPAANLGPPPAAPLDPPGGLLPTPTAPASLPAAQSVDGSPHAEAALVSPAGMDATLGYTVRPGDTLFTVALETGLNLDDAPCAIAPDFTPDQPLVIGNVLSIPPANLACHSVVPGDTLATVAAQYGASAEQIYLLPWNRLTAVPLAQVTLSPGAHLRVPLPLPAFWAGAASSSASGAGASGAGALPEGLAATSFLPLMLAMPVDTSPFTVLGGGGGAELAVRQPQRRLLGPIPADWPYGSGHFVWPVYGWLSQSYRYDHRAIDVAANLGTPVTAADRGVVVRAGWNDQGYGNFVIIDHQIDYVTLYAHLDAILVQEGAVVGQGQAIGTVGSTGNSTGPHLHFEIRDFGRLANPLELLALE